jgi:hypothetical protein
MFASLYVCLATSSRQLTPAYILKLVGIRIENRTEWEIGTYPDAVDALVPEIERPSLVCYVLVKSSFN